MKALTPKPAHGASGTEKDPRWAAVVARDRGADGTFYYSVSTTGVYCRPSCGARLAEPRERALPRAPRADAERAGFRPCKRCKPERAAAREAACGEDRRGCAARSRPPE